MSLFSRCIKITFLTTTCINLAYATSIFPRGCEVTGFGYYQNYLILNESGQQTYYLVQNRTDQKIELERHETDDVFMSPPLQASLDPMNWAAFASDVRNVNFKCYKTADNNTALVNCQDVLEVCQYPRVRFALSNMGNYWIAINKSQHDVIEESVAKGIYLKW